MARFERPLKAHRRPIACWLAAHWHASLARFGPQSHLSVKTGAQVQIFLQIQPPGLANRKQPRIKLGPVALYLATDIHDMWQPPNRQSQHMWHSLAICGNRQRGPGLRASGRISAFTAGTFSGANDREIATLGALVPSVAFLLCLGPFLCNRPIIGRYCPLQMAEAVPYLSLSVALDRDCLGRCRIGKYRERIDFGAHEATGHEFLGGGGRLAECKRSCAVAMTSSPVTVGSTWARSFRPR